MPNFSIHQAGEPHSSCRLMWFPELAKNVWASLSLFIFTPARTTFLQVMDDTEHCVSGRRGGGANYLNPALRSSLAEHPTVISSLPNAFFTWLKRLKFSVAAVPARGRR